MNHRTKVAGIILVTIIAFCLASTWMNYIYVQRQPDQPYQPALVMTAPPEILMRQLNGQQQEQVMTSAQLV